MKAIVVYESLWGNTAAVARAIAEGLGEGARALPTTEATPEVVAESDLVVAGSPVFGFSLPTEKMRENIRRDPQGGPAPDLSHPSLRSWLDGLAPGEGRAAAFETRIWWSPRGATSTIEKKLRAAGYTLVDEAHRFVVTDKFGPLRPGELEKARDWGASLASARAGEMALRA
jgi:flavorubredoxin